MNNAPAADEFGGYSKAWFAADGTEEHFSLDSISKAVGIDIEKKVQELIIKPSPAGASKRLIAKPIANRPVIQQPKFTAPSFSKASRLDHTMVQEMKNLKN